MVPVVATGAVVDIDLLPRSLLRRDDFLTGAWARTADREIGFEPRLHNVTTLIRSPKKSHKKQ